MQSKGSPTSSTEAVIEVDPTSPTTGITFLSSTREQLLAQEFEVPTEEEEKETYFKPLIEEPKELEEKLDSPIIEPNIYYEESIKAEEGEGEVQNGNGEQHRIGGGGGGGNKVVGRGGGRGRGRGNPEPFGFPILDEDTTLTMKNISPSILPNFHGIRSEDPKTFLFEFEVLYRSYDYLNDAQKLKLFPTTLKDSTLKWFTILETNSIRTWEQMKHAFLEKYKDYCMPHIIKDIVFKMVQKEDENIEDFVERFVYNITTEKMNNMDDETLKDLLLKSTKDELIDLLHLMGKGDIS